MKNLRKVVASLVAVAIMAGGVSIVNTLNNNVNAASTAVQPNVINVSGSGSVKVAPDIAYIDLGVQTRGDDSKAAQNENAKLMDKILKEIKALGVSDKDIQTSNYYIYPEYNYDSTNKENKIIGYTVNNNINIKVRDISKAGTVLDKATEVGANVANGIRFGIAEPEQYYNQALKEAISNAKVKAGVIADTLNVKINQPTKVSEQGSYYPAQIYGNYNSRAALESAADDSNVSIESGEMEITAQVSVEYQY